jgi:hypothetical protein
MNQDTNIPTYSGGKWVCKDKKQRIDKKGRKHMEQNRAMQIMAQGYV